MDGQNRINGPEKDGALRVHAIHHGSRVNGPGNRSVVHTQGCTLGCPGCFNPATHSSTGGTLRSVASVMNEILAAKTDGLTISGGEPTEQMGPVINLLKLARVNGLSTLVFSGRTLLEIQKMTLGAALLEAVDVLIDGRFDLRKPVLDGCWGSSNQRVHFLSGRHHPSELKIHAVEVTIQPNGKIMVSGFPDAQLLNSLSAGLGPSAAEEI